MKKLLLIAPFAMIFAAGIANAEEQTNMGGEHHKKGRMGQALSKLPPEKAAAFRDTMTKNKDANVATREQIKKLEEKKFSILTAEKFDQAAYVATTAEIHKLHQTIMSSHCDAFAGFAAGLSQTERTTLAESMKKEHGRGMMHEDKD